jgi:VWFA-related protein
MRIRLLVSAALLAAVAGGVAAQDPPTPQQPVFRAATRLIQVSVVVHDGRKRPVPGLKAEDFQVFEDGKERPVSFFSVLGDAPAAAAAAAASNTVFTNRVQSPSGGGVVAIIYDRLNTAQLEQERVREHIIKYLSQVKPDDRIGLYVLTENGMAVLHDFTRDARSLLRVLNRSKGESAVSFEASNERPSDYVGFGDALDSAMEAFVRNGEANARAFFERRRALISIDGLEAVAKHLQGVSGRKNIIWISSGFPFEIWAFQPTGSNHIDVMSQETARAARALNDTDAAVYAVDARGLVGAFSTPPAARQQAFTNIDTVQKPIEGLRQFAQRTGGEAFFNTNDLGAAIARAVDDSRLTYILGYYPANEEWDGKFRQIKVKVRRDGVDVRHRAGYFAIPPSAVETRASSMLDTLRSPLESTALPISVTVQRGADERVTLQVQFEPGTPLLEKRGDTWHGAIDLLISQTMPPGEHTSETDVTVPLTLNDAMRGQLLKEGLRFTRTITLRDEAHDVRIVARDPATGHTGSVIIPASALRSP